MCKLKGKTKQTPKHVVLFTTCLHLCHRGHGNQVWEEIASILDIGVRLELESLYLDATEVSAENHLPRTQLHGFCCCCSYSPGKSHGMLLDINSLYLCKKTGIRPRPPNLSQTHSLSYERSMGSQCGVGNIGFISTSPSRTGKDFINILMKKLFSVLLTPYLCHRSSSRYWDFRTKRKLQEWRWTGSHGRIAWGWGGWSTAVIYLHLPFRCVVMLYLAYISQPRIGGLMA